jgi:hypothetical protein
VRVAVRHPERASLLERGDRAGQITAVYADVWEEASVGAAMEGAQSSGSASPTIGPKDAERRQSRSRVVQEGARPSRHQPGAGENKLDWYGRRLEVTENADQGAVGKLRRHLIG